MVDLSVRPDTLLFDTRTGYLTREGFLLLSGINTSVQDATSEFVKLTATQTLTNKTLPGAVITSPTGIVKGDVGLGNVDNTSDATKNAAIATLTNKTLISPTGIVKADVGLGNVDNTSDATKNSAAVTLSNKTFGNAPIFPEFAVASLPDAATFDKGVIIVPDETGGRTLATSDGTDWRRVSDGVVVS